GRPHRGRRRRKSSSSVIPASRCRSRGASPTCSTKRSSSSSRTTSSRLTLRSSRRSRTSCGCKAEGHLLNYKPQGFDAIEPSFKDPDGAFYGTMVIAMPYMVNTEHVSSADVPDSALDFLKPQFRGKAVTPYPADDDATLWLFHHVVQKYGWDWMDKYMLNKPNFIQGHLGQQRSVASGQNIVAIDSIFNITEPMKREGKPVAS